MISDPDPEPDADHLDTKLSWKFFAAIPTFLTIYTFQTSFFSAFAALKYKTKKNGLLADGGGRIIAFFTYTTSPLIAFGLYGKTIKSNLLLNVAKDSGAIPIILMFLFMIIAFLTISIVFYVGKEAVLIMFDEITRGTYSGRYLKKKKEDVPKEPENSRSVNSHNSNEEEVDHSQQVPEVEQESEREPQQPQADTTVEEKEKEFIPNMKEYLTMRPIYYYSIVLTCWVIVVILSIVVGDVSVFFGIIGSLTSNFTIFIGPGSFYVIIHYKKKLGFPTRWSKIKYGIAWVYAVFGVISACSLCTCVIVNAVVS